MVQATPPNFTIGDWMCPNPMCNFHNYASRTHCLKCCTYKPHNMYTHPSSNVPFRPGDWMCPNPSCLFQNFASRTHCMKCGTANMGYDAYGNPIPYSVKLRDPWPYNPSLQEWSWQNFAGRVRNIFRVWVQ